MIALVAREKGSNNKAFARGFQLKAKQLYDAYKFQEAQENLAIALELFDIGDVGSPEFTNITEDCISI
jgi:hypothetical protein